MIENGLSASKANGVAAGNSAAAQASAGQQASNEVNGPAEVAAADHESNLSMTSVEDNNMENNIMDGIKQAVSQIYPRIFKQ